MLALIAIPLVFAEDLPPPLAAVRPALTLDAAGRVLDRNGRIVPMRRLMRMVDDPETAAAYRRANGTATGLGVTGMVVGGLSALSGGFVVMVTGPGTLFGADFGDTFGLAALTATAGLAAMGGGIVGLEMANETYGDPAHWYDPVELEALIGTRQAATDDAVAPRAAALHLSVKPVLGLGAVGLQGTF